MFSRWPERDLDREKISKSDMICMQTLMPNSNFAEEYNQPRPKSVGLFSGLRNESSRANTSINNNAGNSNSFDETLDSSNHKHSDRYHARLNTQLLEAVEHRDAEKVERLILEGANQNATCRLGHNSACHIAALVGGDSLSILLKYGADKDRSSKIGATPMHMAAWAGNFVQIALLLGLPEKIQREIETGLTWHIIEEKIRRLNGLIKSMANVKSKISTVTVLAKTWKDSFEHNCKDLKLPFIESSWTPLHVASSCARPQSVRLLLAAGANPNHEDIKGQTPLNVAGSAFYRGLDIGFEEEIIKILLVAGSKFNAVQSDTVKYIDSPLHTAMELEYMEIAKIILNAGGSIKHLNNAGETPLHVCIRKKSMGIEIFSNHYLEDTTTAFDVNDKNGYTVLHAAMKAAWISGVYIALENGADITLQANNGDAPIHAAAELGDIGILNELLSIAQRNNTLDYQNESGATALFKAIIHGHRNCVEVILKKGASVFCKLPGNFNVLHVAAKYGRSDILQILLKHNDVITSSMINKPTTEHERLGPLHLAVIHNHPDCVKLLLNNNTNNRLQFDDDDRSFNAVTPLYIAAVKNHLNIAHILLEHDKSTLHEIDSCNWTPLHAASFYGNEDIILLFIRKGADITVSTKGPNNFKKTCVDLIMTNVSKPTQFMEDLFDSYIYSDESTHVPYFVNVDYRILTSNVEASEQIKIVETLLKTGNRFGQSRLLVHPLIESFLYLNWVYLLPFFYIILGLYGLYVLSLNIFIISTYFVKDTKDVPPTWLNPVIWRVFVYITGTLILLQEFLYIHFGSKRYFYRLESWIKIATIALAMLIPIVLSFWPDDAWTRHVTTVTLLLSWTEMLFILSRFPNWGYYVLMFGKVLSKVLKILLTFVFLIIGFALSFMVQFHYQAPFDNPWTAFVKTTVMMTSEFDYLDLFDDKQIKGLAISLIVIRILFLIFLILGGIVLMNLMVGVAVNDLHNLEIHGNIKRLEKQVEFLSSLESVVYNKYLNRYLPSCLTLKRRIFNNIILSAVDCELLPLYLKDAIFHKAQVLKAKRENKLNPEILKNKNRRSSLNSNSIKVRPLDKNLGYNNLTDISGENKLHTDRDAMVELKERMEHMTKEMEVINALLHKINSIAS